MAVVMSFVSYWIFRLVKGKTKAGVRFYLAALFAGHIGLSVAAILTGFEFGIQPL
jgi:cobalt/nickel transport system permease protein